MRKEPGKIERRKREKYGARGRRESAKRNPLLFIQDYQCIYSIP